MSSDTSYIPLADRPDNSGHGSLDERDAPKPRVTGRGSCGGGCGRLNLTAFLPPPLLPATNQASSVARSHLKRIPATNQASSVPRSCLRRVPATYKASSVAGGEQKRPADVKKDRREPQGGPPVIFESIFNCLRSDILGYQTFCYQIFGALISSPRSFLAPRTRNM